jgi:pimeloyl-ACP methyl ester carboxylesterase
MSRPSPPNAGEEVVLFVRERIADDGAKERRKRRGGSEVVLFVHGGSVRQVHLIGWSGGVFRVGIYAATYPEKVKTVYFYAGPASPTAPSEPPSGLPEPGYPLNLQTHEGFMQGRWDAEVGCEDQFDPAIRPVIWNTMMSFDPLGSTWGSLPWNPVASPEGGILRYPTAAFDWGWNAEMAAKVEAPSVVIVGEFDGLREPSRGLYEALGTKHKVFIEVACASHFLVWENQHEILFDTSEEWLRKGTIDGDRTGEFWVDESGRLNAQ